ncbi:ABC-F family ATP-binding cassette domain-containing protein [Pararhodobacter sp. CCB-MM2]|uniref:ABC-F family ATP-binding cassette domain-containing protein n=1 Tax=Pararhodobacter sp. CCB-MM2 TaxID=1786003 RepID=UPI00082DD3E8|nr:ABC-F family ATP-binding cassette domain-containing protein [Pararhodobacter sp. CCB-MM2]
MPVTLSSLSFATPEGTPLFTDLTLAFGPERTGLVGRNGTGKSTLLALMAGRLQPSSGRVQVDGRLSVLRQSFAPGETLADLFDIRAALALLDRAEAGTASAEELADADWTLPSRLEAALASVGLSCAPETPLETLSGGQATRAALAAVMFDAPDMLLLDEPTNNLDREGRQAVIDLLAAWPRGAVVVSHDRELLEGMDAIVELTSLGATRFGGGYSAYRAQKDVQLAAAAHDLGAAERQRDEAAKKAQQAAERKAKKDAAGKRSRAKGGQPKMLMDKAQERAEGSKGAGIRLREARAAEAEAGHEAARAKVEVLQPMRMDLPSTGLPREKVVLRLEGVTGGYGDVPVIRDASWQLTGPERVAITGPNGCGKSTLLALVTGALVPIAGQVHRPVAMALLDQSVNLLDPDETLREAFLRLNPGADENGARATLARFKFRADEALRKVGSLSGGQRLRGGLACTLGGPQPPGLLILDEPTNHLDLDAIEALESALAGYDGALLVVSHDARFLDALGLTRRITLGS